MGNSGTPKVEMNLEDWCIRHRLDKPAKNLASMGRFVAPVRLVVAMTGEHLRRSLPRIPLDRNVGDT